MRETYFKAFGRAFKKALVLLCVSIWNEVLNYKAFTAFIISMAVNIWLMWALMSRTVERDKYNTQLYRTECQLDSVRIVLGR